MNVTRKTAVAATAAFLFSVSSGGAAQEPVREGPPQVTISGRGEVRVTPDLATLMVGVQTRALTAAEATSENSRKQRAVIEAVRAKGVAASQIGTSSFSVQPETQYDQRGQAAPKTTGYLVSNVVTVELRRVELVGPVLDAALGAGANQVHSLSYSVANPDSARHAALSQAVGRARADAEVAAGAAGGSLGPLLEIITTDYQVPFFQSRVVSARMGEVEAAPAPPAEPGSLVISASVTTRWRFLLGPPR